MPRIVEQLTAAATNAETECEWLLTFIFDGFNHFKHKVAYLHVRAYMFYLKLIKSYSSFGLLI